MANVKFLRGLYADYSNLTPKDTDTLYITGASQGSYDSIYLGANLLGSTSLGKLPFDAVNYNDTYNGEQPFTESNLSAATTLLDVIAVLENKIADLEKLQREAEEQRSTTMQQVKWDE